MTVSLKILSGGNVGIIKQLANSVNSEYLQWLMELTGMDNPNESYLFLASTLFKTPFISYIDFDTNRIADGRQLRIEYEQTCRYTLEDKNEFVCSVFEVLLALSRRMEMQTDIQAIDWFWNLLENLNLHHYTDKQYYDNGGPVEISNILDRWIERKYHRSGRMGVFPLNYTKNDQRDVELWYQMQSYLKENCDF